MTVYALENALLGVAADRPAIDDPTIPRNGSQPPTYICIDTLEVFQDTGSDWLFIGQFGFPGVTGDGQNGIIVSGIALIDGNLTVGDPTFGSLATFNGNVLIDPPIAPFGAPTLELDQTASVLDLEGVDQPAVLIVRDNSGGLTMTRPIVSIQLHDGASTADILHYFSYSGNDDVAITSKGAVTASSTVLAGAGSATPTLAVSKLAGQTGLLIACTDENNAPKVSIAVDGEIVTADDVLAPNGVIKGATVALYASGTGAPSSGTHSQGEFHADTAGALFYCVADGTPGTWKTVTLT